MGRLKASEFQLTLSSGAGATLSPALTPTDIFLENGKMPVTVFPNPAPGGRFRVNLGSISGHAKLSVQINDAQGRVVYQKNEVANRVLVVKTQLQPGMYLLQIRSDAGMVHQQKLLVQ